MFVFCQFVLNSIVCEWIFGSCYSSDSEDVNVMRPVFCFCFGSLLVGGGKSSFLFLVFCFQHLKMHAGVRVFCLVLLPRVTREVTQNKKSSCHGLIADNTVTTEVFVCLMPSILLPRPIASMITRSDSEDKRSH